MNVPAAADTPVSPLVTVTVLAPVVAAAVIDIFAVSCVALTQVVELVVMPVPENAAAKEEPLTKPVPFMVTVRLVAP